MTGQNSTSERPAPGPEGERSWLETAAHRHWMSQKAQELLRFYQPSLNPQGGFFVLDHSGAPLPQSLQELHTTTRLVHSYALGHLAGAPDCVAIVDHGMRYLWDRHRDQVHGGYLWALDGDGIGDDRKLAYGHGFVLLAASSAKLVGHPDADRLLDDISEVMDQRFWEEGPGLFADEFNRDWTPFSTYRGMNANMHSIEALLAAFEATKEAHYLSRAGRILEFFLDQMAPNWDMRLPEHYNEDWSVDPTYAGNPIFRPAGTTPGHSLEVARLALQYWDLRGRQDTSVPQKARALAYRALEDAWDAERGGLIYTLDLQGQPDVRNRYWWPVTEGIGVLATLMKLGGALEDEIWYRRLWRFADHFFLDHDTGGWFPEVDTDGQPDHTQFQGKPDIYHALQAHMFPLAPGVSRLATTCKLESN